ncbi:hypothetical protein, partial [Burkholderia sp.]|uniref:hypothetical protein n=1 Tax=Burkholderia sp. TaxID=36773 RepID=UPI00258ACAF9
ERFGRFACVTPKKSAKNQVWVGNLPAVRAGSISSDNQTNQPAGGVEPALLKERRRRDRHRTFETKTR